MPAKGVRATIRRIEQSLNDVSPGLGGKLIGRARFWWRYRRNVAFDAWHMYSKLRYGETRWVEDGLRNRVLVRSDDVRAFFLAREPQLQRGTVRVWRALAALRPDAAIDVGANYGEFALALSGTSIRVAAVEAHPALIACLRQTCAGHPNITVRHYAVSDADGVTGLFFDPGSLGGGSIERGVPPAEQKYLLTQAQVIGVEVPSRRITTLVQELFPAGVSSLILKVDVEGAEDKVLAGAEEVLGRLDWWRAIVEFNPRCLERAGKDVRAVWSYFRRYPGLLITEHGSPSDFALLQAELPVEPPTVNSDIIIGQGAAGTAPKAGP